MMGPSSYINTHNLPTHHFTWKMLIHIKKKNVASVREEASQVAQW